MRASSRSVYCSKVKDQMTRDAKRLHGFKVNFMNVEHIWKKLFDGWKISDNDRKYLSSANLKEVAVYSGKPIFLK